MPRGKPVRVVALLLIAIGAVVAVALHFRVNQRDVRPLAVAYYEPKTQIHIDDLSTPVADVLRQLPGVVQVEVAVGADKPTHRIVHLRDWHFVPRDLYALDNKDGSYQEFP